MRKISILSLASLLTLSAFSADIPKGKAELILEAHDVTGFGGVGFQWILDSKHSTYNEVFYPFSWSYYGEYAPNFDYFIPEDAEPKYPTDKMVIDGEASVYVPAGVYDWMVIQPDYDGMLFAAGDMARVDDFTLAEGETYRIIVTNGNGDGEFGFFANLQVTTDLALTSLKLPLSSISLTSDEPISVTITNKGTKDIKDFEVSYSINGGTPVTEKYEGSIKPGETADYTFKTSADLSKKGEYSITASVNASGDLILSNNTMEGKTCNLTPADLPYSVDFSTITPEEFPEQWFIINNTPDAGWNYSEWKMNKDGNMGAAFCQSGYNQDGDDWMISHPLNFKAGKAHLLFSACTVSEEQPEFLEIYIGSNLNTEEMTRVAEYSLTSPEWSDKAVNFNIPEDGVYYVAFHGISPSTSFSFSIGDVTIDAGEFIGSPLIKMERVLAPYSTCDLSTASKLGMRVTNKGTGAMTGHTLTAYVNDVKYVTDFSDPVNPDETVDLYMDRTFDFSGLGTYEIQLILSYDESDLSEELTIDCLEPLTEFPVVTNFPQDVNTSIWQSMTQGAWSYEPMFEVFTAEKPGKENGLLSRGIRFSNPARFKISYMAPGWDTGTIAVYMGPASADPLTYTEVFRDGDVANDAKEIEFTAPIAAPGNYSFIISDEAPTDSRNRLRLNEVEITEVNAYDICLSNVEGYVAPYTPAKTVKGEHSYKLTVLNRGSETMSGIWGAAMLDGNMINDSAEGLTLEPGESGVLEMTVNLPEKSVGDSFELSFKVEGGKEDAFPADNSVVLPVCNVTESVFAHEDITDLTYGTGNNGEPLYVGYVYSLPETTDATGMAVGLSITEEEDLPNVKADVAFSVYKLKADGSIDRRLWSETRTRGKGGMLDIDFQDMRLEAGDYYFEVAQLSDYNMGLAYDVEGETTCYTRTGDNTLVPVRFYPVCIRAQFAPGAKVYAADAAATRFTAPGYTEGLYSENTTVKAIARNAGYKQADFKVELTLDGIKAGETNVSLAPYDEQEVTFEGIDLSNAGTHTLTATAIMAGDENADNNSADLNLNIHAEADPYLMDFENCFNFDAAGDPWNPRWTTIDRNGVGTDLFWRYQHPHRGEPVGFMAFNIKETVPSMEEVPLQGFYPHSGERFGVAFHIDPWSEGAENLEASDVWIISPKLQLGKDSEFELYVKTRMLEGDFSQLEPYRILISETDANPESFIVLGDDERLAAVEDWEKVTVNLSAYDGKAVHVALQYTGRPRANTCLMIDDLHIKTDLPNSIETVESEKPVLVNGHDIIAPAGSHVYTPDGIECGFTNLSSGIYIVKTPTLSVKVFIP